jgi:predicted P-loop ATPase
MSLPKQLFYSKDAHLYRDMSITDMIDDRYGYKIVRKPLPSDFYERHASGKERFGVGFIRPGTDRCMAAMIDLDDHDGSIGLDAVDTLANDFVERLASEMIYGHAVRSAGGKGTNIWMIWDEPQQAAGVRAALLKVATDLGYKSGAAGITKKQVEIFPKQDSLEVGQFGNFGNIPMGDIVWASSVPVEEVVVQAPAPAAEQPMLKPHEIDQLLAHIVNDENTDYEHWITILAAIHQVGGTREQAEAWSKKSPKHNQAEFDKKVKSFKRKAGGQVAGAGTLKKWADEGGWTSFEVDVTEFPMAEVEVDDNGNTPQRYRRNETKGKHQGKVEATLSQVMRCIDKDPEFPWRVAFDEFTQDILLRDLGSPGDQFVRLEDDHKSWMRKWFDDKFWEPVTKDLMSDAVLAVAKEHRLNIATQWANTLRWDGENRYEAALRAMGMEINEYSRAVMKYWWTAHGARVIEPGYQCDSIIVLISPTQGEGKSSMIRALAPQIGPLDTYRDITIEQLLKDDTSARALRGCLIANMDEMRSFGLREAAEAKAALSKCKESFIPKFIEARSEFGRQCVIYATNNKVEFLDDETGNRRYYTLTVKGIDLDWFKANRNQLWAQGVAEFKATGLAWQEAARVAPAHVERHESRDVWEEVVAAYLRREEAGGGCHFEISELLTQVIEMPKAQQDKKDANRMGKILKQLGYENKVVKVGGGATRRWVKKDGNVEAFPEAW